MRIKTYTSDSVPEALKMIKSEMGPGAVILKTNRTVKKRLWGLVPSLAYEITAASDPSALEAEGESKGVAQPVGETGDDVVARSAVPRKEVKPLETYEVAETPPRPRLGGRAAAVSPTSPAAGPAPRLDTLWLEHFNRLSDEIQSVLRLVSHQRAHDAISTLFLRDNAVAGGLQELIWQGEQCGEEHRQAAYAEFQKLILEGVEESLAFVLIRDVFRHLPPDEDASDRLRIRLNKAVSRLARTASIDLQNGPRACIFVGPTGVGKTTTIAKLAARFSLKNRRSIKLLTVDTYRIAAAEQLKTYGDIIGIPVKIVYSIEELDREVRNAGPNETLLIDTTGHSHKRISEYQELSAFVRGNDQIEKHLVLSCTTRQDDLREIVACFGVFRPDRLIFTKLDEASSFGMILNEAVRTNWPLSYLTNGQDVAGDLIIPTPTTLADLLVPII